MESKVRLALIALLMAAPLARVFAREAASGRSDVGPLASVPVTNGTIGLRMDFHNTAVDQVLDYLSAAAHLVIHKEADVRGAINVQSADNLSIQAAVELLNSALKNLGGAASLDGRILTVLNLESAKTSDLEVVSGTDPAVVGKSERVVTQIIPVRYASASQLVNNIQPLLPLTATLSVNESANTLILVATKTQIRRMLKIVSAIDVSMARVATIKVVPLRYADAKQLAGVIQQLASSSQRSAENGPLNFFGGFGPPGAGGGGPGGAGSAENSAPSTAASKITAVADEPSNSLILSASADYLPGLLKMISEIDRPVTDVTELRLFTLQNADPTELAEELGRVFGATSRTSSQDEAPAQVFGGPPGAGGGPGGFAGGPGGGGPGGFGPAAFGASDASSTASARSLKKSQVLAVPDPRTSSLLVSAASTVMPQISKMIEDLDANAAHRELVQVYDLHNADPQDVNQVLQDLFNRNSSTRSNNGNDRSSLLGQGNPLTSRSTEEQNTASSQNSGLGNTSGRGGGTGQGGTSF